MISILIVGIGGFLGSVARYLVSIGVPPLLDSTSRMPWTTLLINVLGSFLIGALFYYLQDENFNLSKAKLFFATGVLGGFTTFSTFSLETFWLLKQGAVLLAIGNVCLQMVFGILAVFIGYLAARGLVN